MSLKYQVTFNYNMRKCFGRHGLCHRINGPAVIHYNGDEYWLRYGFKFRPNNLPACTTLTKTSIW